uniref:Inositol polyphosphate-related phosphatase domain-containing protein n=1 Tax=Ditylenchus dipsaci TaxID=166011 RepID=A0A915DMH7_9BILA
MLFMFTLFLLANIVVLTSPHENPQAHANLERLHSHPSKSAGSLHLQPPHRSTTLREQFDINSEVSRNGSKKFNAHQGGKHTTPPNKPLNIFITTFNAGGQKSADACTSNSAENLKSDTMCHWFDFDPSNPPDLVVIGLQEMVGLTLTNMVSNYVPFTKPSESKWLKALDETLTGMHEHYKQLTSIRLFGLFLVVYHRSSLNMKEFNDDSVATGIKPVLTKQLGNKGGVGISLTIGENLKICFINSHLAAGVEEKRDEARNSDAKRIEEELKFKENNVGDHDVVFWMGDFNYRLSEEMQSRREEVLQKCNSSSPDQKCLDILKHHDQLKKQMGAGNVFFGFHEGEMKFRPTYKFNRGTSDWDDSPKMRVPAWCDRILYKSVEASTK